MHAQINGAASIAEGYISPQTVHNAIFGFAQAPKTGRHLLDDTVKVLPELAENLMMRSHPNACICVRTSR